MHSCRLRAGASIGSTSRCSTPWTRPSSRRSRTSSRAAPGSISGRSTTWSGFPQRLALARKYLPEFGLAAYCGFGRSPVSALPGILGDHLRAAQLTG